MSEVAEVEVLLATFNGSKYLREFLESLVAQRDVKISLTISDDGSTDQTISICENYRNKFHNFKIVQGPRKGAANNFFHLLKSSEAKYLALADQDDIWLPNHLIDSIDRISRFQDDPALSFSSVIEFKLESGFSSKKIWPKNIRMEEIRQILTENPARGCSIVINRAAAEQIKREYPRNCIMHDWWFLLVISCIGNVVWSENPEVLYRIHSTNTVGVPKSTKSRYQNWIRGIKAEKWPLLEQAKELLRIFGPFMPFEKRDELSKWCNRLQSSAIRDRLILTLYEKRYRSKILDELVVRTTYLLLGNPKP